MRKKTLGMLGGVALVAALGLVAFLLLRNAPEEESSLNNSDGSSTASVQLTAQESNSVSSIDVTNATGSFEVVRTKKSSDDSANATYGIAGWEDLPTNTSLLWTLPNNTASLEANGIVEENCTDLAKFGLDEAAAIQVELHFDDGSSYAFRIGNTVSGSENTYLAPAETDTVYTVRTSLVSNYANGAVDFLSKTLLEKPAEEEYPIVKTLTVERADMDYILELDYDEASEDETSMGGTVASHEMVLPVPAYLSVDRSTDVITGMFGLTADAVLVPHPTEEDYVEAGLEEPFGTATMACDDGNTYVLKMSSRYTQKDEETGAETAYYNICLNGVDVIYQIAEENLCWATIQPTDIASKLILGTYVWDVGELVVHVNGGEDFRFQVKGDEKDNAVVTLNGQATDAERYRQFYSFLLNTAADTVELNGTPSGEPLAEISLTTQDGTFSRTLGFYQLDTFTCLITVDGKSAYTCRLSYLDTLRSNMEIFDTEESFATNWS